VLVRRRPKPGTDVTPAWGLSQLVGDASGFDAAPPPAPLRRGRVVARKAAPMSVLNQGFASEVRLRVTGGALAFGVSIGGE
jgi:hypothetical protein